MDDSPFAVLSAFDQRIILSTSLRFGNSKGMDLARLEHSQTRRDSTPNNCLETRETYSKPIANRLHAIGLYKLQALTHPFKKSKRTQGGPARNRLVQVKERCPRAGKMEHPSRSTNKKQEAKARQPDKVCDDFGVPFQECCFLRKSRIDWRGLLELARTSYILPSKQTHLAKYVLSSRP